MEQNRHNDGEKRCRDRGPDPCVMDICKETGMNTDFRAAVWTGCNLQVTLMCIPPEEDIGCERHAKVDQMLVIEEGTCMVKMGCSQEVRDFCCKASKGCAILVPAGTWHNVINTGTCPLKLFTVYAPPQHPKGTVHRCKSDAAKEEH